MCDGNDLDQWFIPDKIEYVIFKQGTPLIYVWKINPGRLEQNENWEFYERI